MASTSDSIYALWDRLAEFPVAQVDEAFVHLLASLCTEFCAWNAGWLFAVRMGEANPDDPFGGWRPRDAGYLHLNDEIEAARRAQYARLASGIVDPTIPRNLQDAGRWRANRLVDLAGPEWFQSEVYRHFFLATGRADAVWIGCPINPDVETFIGVFRRDEQPRFSSDERDGLLAALRGLKWFFRQHLLSHGLTVADTPLTPTEREILKMLVAGASKESIAERTGRSPHTVHHHCKSLYQKFGVTNRVRLMALSLGTAQRRRPAADDAAGSRLRRD